VESCGVSKAQINGHEKWCAQLGGIPVCVPLVDIGKTIHPHHTLAACRAFGIEAKFAPSEDRTAILFGELNPPNAASDPINALLMHH